LKKALEQAERESPAPVQKLDAEDPGMPGGERFSLEPNKLYGSVEAFRRASMRPAGMFVLREPIQVGIWMNIQGSGSSNLFLRPGRWKEEPASKRLPPMA
jgi:hypothetical protein